MNGLISEFLLCAITLTLLMLTCTDTGAETNLIRTNPDFTCVKAWRVDEIPGWKAISTPAASQRAVIVSDKGKNVLRFTKTNKEPGNFYRLVNKLSNITLNKGQEYVFSFKCLPNEMPSQGVGVNIGLSVTGGSPLFYDGTDDFIPNTIIELNQSKASQKTQQIFSVKFVPEKDYRNPFLLISASWWTTCTYSLDIGDFSLTTEEIAVADRSGMTPEIVISSDSLMTVRYAADELCRYLEKATGSRPEIVTASSDYKAPADNKTRIYVGTSPLSRARGLDPNSLKPDGFFISAAQDGIALVGRDEPVPFIENMQISARYEQGIDKKNGICAIGQTGSLFAVYEFLKQYCGVGWYWPGELGEITPICQRVSLPLGLTTVEPDFSLRMRHGMDLGKNEEIARWYKHAGMGATTDPLWPNHSTAYIYQNPENYQKHPEWFALHNGKRGGVDLCWTAPGLVDEWVRLALDFFTKFPNAQLFPVVPEDGSGICECPNCQALVDYSPPFDGDNPLTGNQLMGNLVFPVVNEIAKRVGKDYPDKYIGSLAYATYLKPPTVIEKLEPNVLVMFCAMTPLYYDPTYANGMRTFEQGWHNLGLTKYANWDYLLLHEFITGNNGMFTPYIIPHILADWYSPKQGKSYGVFFEANNYHFKMDHLNSYVLNMLSWDLSSDVDWMIFEYAQHCYGSAANNMLEFWRIQEKAWISRSNSIGAWNGDLVGRWNHVYTPTVLRDMFKALDSAIRLAEKSDSTAYIKRIKSIADEYQILRSCLVDNWKGLTKMSTVKNGGFERSKKGGVADWITNDGAKTSQTERLSNRFSMRMEDGNSIAISDVIHCKPGKSYIMSAWFKTRGSGDTNSSAASPRLDIIKAEENSNSESREDISRLFSTGDLAHSIAMPGYLDDWQRIYVVCSPGCSVRIRLRGAQGFTCYYDDVNIEELQDDWKETILDQATM